ncbi:MAG: PKD domain-containing protein [Polyangiaceae bacterium]|nr:PKD domain-containing protein [Polyangiaceae bacterium]
MRCPSWCPRRARRLTAPAVLLALTACGSDAPAPAARTGADAGIDAAASDAGADAPPDAGELTARAIAPAYAFVGEPVVLDGAASTGAVSYQWTFGDGDGWDAPRAETSATVTYAAPGRYAAVLAVRDAVGRQRTDSVTVSVTWPAAFVPSGSSTLAVVPGEQRVAVVGPDSDEVTFVEWTAGGAFSVAARVTVPGGPATLTAWGDVLAVPCRDAGVVALVPTTGAGTVRSVAMPYGSRPYGAAVVGDALFVSLQGTGELARVERDAQGEPSLVARLPAVVDARGVAALPDGRLAVTRFRSASSGAEIAVVDPQTGGRSIWPLGVDPQAGSDTENGGVPTYLGQVVVSPTGREIALPGLQANVVEGQYVNGVPLTFQTTLRAVTAFVDLPGGGERAGDRHQFDNRGFASAAAFSSRGDFLFVAMRGNRAVERYDLLRRDASGNVQDLGYAPNGVALSADDRLLFVDAYLSREVVVYDVSDLSTSPVAVARLPIVSAEPLSPTLLRGKQLFDDSADPRISKDSYIACGHCHLEGDSDQRVWDFTDRGEGMRNTISLLGRAGTGDGPVHWSANFDEIQDFENDIRNAFRGTGLLTDTDWSAGTRAQTLGDPKAGASTDLDALAAYVTSLASELPSPFREADGSLGAGALRGKALFESAAVGCTACHAGARLTDSGFVSPGVPRLHDVGTIGAASGQRLGATLTGLDTPTLHGLWHSAPYLHDGSAATLEAVLARNALDQHGVTSGLSAGDRSDLVAYLLCLDGRTD